LSVLLSACGGGGSDNSPAPAGLLASGLNVTEYLGTWLRSDSANCYTAPEYGQYYFKSNPAVITTTALTLNVTLYTDMNCTAKAGKLSETSSVSYSAATIAGKTNVVRVLLSFTGSTSGADGGSGLTFTKVPDGSFSGTKTPSKGLFDVEGGVLYASPRSSPLDADGYPTTVDYSGAFSYAR
jgi:hypothetical protein